jgi:hypothetical protein
VNSSIPCQKLRKLTPYINLQMRAKAHTHDVPKHRNVCTMTSLLKQIFVTEECFCFSLLLVGCSLRSFFYTRCGCTIFLRKSGELVPDYAALHLMWPTPDDGSSYFLDPTSHSSDRNTCQWDACLWLKNMPGRF